MPKTSRATAAAPPVAPGEPLPPAAPGASGTTVHGRSRAACAPTTSTVLLARPQGTSRRAGRAG